MTKQEIRQYYKQKRLALTESELEEKSKLICTNIFSNFQLDKKTISLFLSIERHKEINTFPILEKCIEHNVKIALPKTVNENNSLIHYHLDSKSQIIVNAYGIPEPAGGKIISPEKFDYVFVPLLAIDDSGQRVGYGKGFYDQFLSKCPLNCLFIGLHLFNEYVEIDDLNAHDIPLDFCVTPNKVIRFEL